MNPENSQAALAQLQQIQSQAQNPNDILANQRQQLGANAAQETVTGLRGAINNTTKLLKQVAPSVMGRTGNSLVTNAQAGRIIQNEEAPIAQNLTDQGTQYTQASDDLTRLEDQAGKAASGIYQSQQDKLSYAQNLYNALYQRERDAEADRVAEVQRQEEIRRFNEALRQKSSSSGGGSGGTSFNLSAPTGRVASVPSAKDQAYSSVQNFLSKGRAAAEADYRATLKSANYGNPMDKLKVQLYNQKGIGVPIILSGRLQ